MNNVVGDIKQKALGNLSKVEMDFIKLTQMGIFDLRYSYSKLTEGQKNAVKKALPHYSMGDLIKHQIQHTEKIFRSKDGETRAYYDPSVFDVHFMVQSLKKRITFLKKIRGNIHKNIDAYKDNPSTMKRIKKELRWVNNWLEGLEKDVKTFSSTDPFLYICKYLPKYEKLVQKTPSAVIMPIYFPPKKEISFWMVSNEYKDAYEMSKLSYRRYCLDVANRFYQCYSIIFTDERMPADNKPPLEHRALNIYWMPDEKMQKKGGFLLHSEHHPYTKYQLFISDGLIRHENHFSVVFAHELGHLWFPHLWKHKMQGKVLPSIYESMKVESVDKKYINPNSSRYQHVDYFIMTYAGMRHKMPYNMPPGSDAILKLLSGQELSRHQYQHQKPVYIKIAPSNTATEVHVDDVGYWKQKTVTGYFSQYNIHETGPVTLDLSDAVCNGAKEHNYQLPEGVGVHIASSGALSALSVDCKSYDLNELYTNTVSAAFDTLFEKIILSDTADILKTQHDDISFDLGMGADHITIMADNNDFYLAYDALNPKTKIMDFKSGSGHDVYLDVRDRKLDLGRVGDALEIYYESKQGQKQTLLRANGFYSKARDCKIYHHDRVLTSSGILK